MRFRRTAILGLAAVAVAVALPAAAFAHAALVRATPSASGLVNTPPRQVTLQFTEPVEPRFAIVSVTDANGDQKTAKAPRRSPADRNTLVVPLERLAHGWYLVYWRVISVDGHPVRGAFTFAVGPNPGPAPQFVIPSTSETAATPKLIAARWAALVSLMAAIGLFVLRIAVARPLVTRVAGSRLRRVTLAFGIASAVALVAIPVYFLLATSEFALRSFWDFGDVFPLVRASAFGRGWLDLELVFALFAGAAAIAIWLDRPERRARSVAALIALGGALAAAGATLLVPGTSGHPGQTAPRGLSLAFDWFHLASGSIWVGGLIGLLVLAASQPAAQRVAALVVCVPRFSNVALASVLVLIASGIGSAIKQLPTLATLWETSYGQTLLVKIGLLAAALLLAAVNLLRTTPRFRASDLRPELGPPAASLLRKLVGGEVLLVVGAVLGAAVLTSLAPPSKALASIGHANARVGPGRVDSVVQKNGYRLAFRVTPNRAAVPNSFEVGVTRNGRAVRGADVTVNFAMLDMSMGEQEYRLPERSPGRYGRAEPALVMVGHWGLEFRVAPRGGSPFTVVLVDKANG
ncbi:MAG TPA: copper resistance protein CopC [Gaiellaceae bacterium]|nr:copper resistance protein CopC [Gaiellaceae bacterium]